ncbi:hypothetical protein B0H14DRAFT_2607369 [Mycena olivaceomarginata]|nr:hypothetical protein B0H14DRAFT_2607369 [Mycena olivaceomarginata]
MRMRARGERNVRTKQRQPRRVCGEVIRVSGDGCVRQGAGDAIGQVVRGAAAGHEDGAEEVTRWGTGSHRVADVDVDAAVEDRMGRAGTEGGGGKEAGARVMKPLGTRIGGEHGGQACGGECLQKVAAGYTRLELRRELRWACAPETASQGGDVEARTSSSWRGTGESSAGAWAWVGRHRWAAASTMSRRSSAHQAPTSVEAIDPAVPQPDKFPKKLIDFYESNLRWKEVNH